MALTQSPVVGKDCKAYINGGTHASPTWSEITHAVNVSMNQGKSEADISARYAGHKLTKGALKEKEFSFTYRHKQGADTVFDTLLAAYNNGTPKEFAFMDAAITEVGAQGPRAYCEVLAMNVTQELENSMEVEFTLKPTYFEESGSIIEPDWYEVSA